MAKASWEFILLSIRHSEKIQIDIRMSIIHEWEKKQPFVICVTQALWLAGPELVPSMDYVLHTGHHCLIRQLPSSDSGFLESYIIPGIAYWKINKNKKIYKCMYNAEIKSQKVCVWYILPQKIIKYSKVLKY
jgi:hypothetical protein